jgi:hypothetical protein
LLDERTKARVHEAVLALAGRLDHHRRLESYAEHRWTDAASAYPVLHLEDVSGIPFVCVVPGVEEYQHRARVRAGTGEMFAAVTPPTDGYEDYCRNRLGLGSPELIQTSPGDHSYAVAIACGRSPAFERIAAIAEKAGGLAIHPYMAIEDVWKLAERLARTAGVPVHVLGPPPPALWIANDKGTLSEVVSSVLSPDWLVETQTASEPAEMAHRLLQLARRHQKVGLKRTRCASATGNAVYDLAKIERMKPEEIVDEVKAFLERTEWALDEEVLVVAWEQTDDSPSTQLWIPPEGNGLPRVDGVYEQILEGEEKVFLGSRPSTLAPEINQLLTDASVLVATALQSLGYVGRCSFDFIVVSGGAGGSRAKFTECNGRWGGTSTPMHLIDRLLPGRRPPYWAQDFMHRGLVGVGFDEILELTGDALFHPATGQGRYIFYNVGPLERTGKLDVIALGSTAAEAEESIGRDLPRRLGLDTS